MESIVETMMQQLLSKEILHEPMKEIAERYPKWLEEHKKGLDPEEYARYFHQYEFIVKLNEVYEHDSDNFPKIVELMKAPQSESPRSPIYRQLLERGLNDTIAAESQAGQVTRAATTPRMSTLTNTDMKTPSLSGRVL